MTTPVHTQAGAAVRVTGIVKQYRDARAVDGVDLDIRSGEFLTLLGSSGSGKSTLLNIIAGFTSADAGTIEVDGVDITHVPPHKRGLGMVFQHYALFPHMSVFDNVAFALRRRKTPKAEVAERVQEALDIVELGHLGQRMPTQLSGGQQQRVALARSIVFRPRVLLMDEPLGALDKRLRQQLQIEIKRLHRELGITFVFVTHDQEEALAMSDRIALLRDGQIVQLGSPTELYERPNQVYAAEFLGESNIFHGTFHDGMFHERGSGALLHVTAPGDEGDGAIIVRPEHVQVLPADGRPPQGCNMLPASVEEVIYLGSDCRVEVSIPDGGRLIARTPADDRYVRLLPGDRVNVCWAAEHGVAVRAQSVGSEVLAPAIP